MSTDTAKKLEELNTEYENILKEQEQLREYHTTEQLARNHAADELDEIDTQRSLVSFKIETLKKERETLLKSSGKEDYSLLLDLDKKLGEQQSLFEKLNLQYSSWEEDDNAHVESMYYLSCNFKTLKERMEKIESEMKALVEGDNRK
jgi:chromosome segregation ATPase